MTNLGGVYRIVNLVNCKSYIGSTRSFIKRRASHVSSLRRGKHHNPKLQRSWNKYGESNFKFEILECCQIEDLFNREDFYIRLSKPNFNVGGVTHTRQGAKHSDETKSLISFKKSGIEMTEENKLKISKALTGKKKTKEHIEKVAAKSRGLIRGKQSLERKLKVSKPIVVLDTLTGTELNFNGYFEAIASLNVIRQQIYGSIKLGYLISDRYRVKLVGSEYKIPKRFLYEGQIFSTCFDISKQIKCSTATVSRMKSKGIIKEI